MPLFRISVKQPKITGGQRIEKGMSVDVITNSLRIRLLQMVVNQ